MAGIKRQKRFPIGYRIQNGRAEVVPEEAELVRRIFRDYLEGSTTYDQRAGEVDDYIRKAGVLSREFDNDLVWRLIQTVKVINQNKIELQFRSGIVMVQRLDKWEN